MTGRRDAKFKWLIPFVYSLFLMLPIYWLLNMSFKTTNEILGTFSLFPQEFTLENYEAIFTGQTVDVAGRSAERLRIQRRTVPDRRFLVDVDPDNGLVRRARDEGGALDDERALRRRPGAGTGGWSRARRAPRR